MCYFISLLSLRVEIVQTTFSPECTMNFSLAESTIGTAEAKMLMRTGSYHQYPSWSFLHIAFSFNSAFHHRVGNGKWHKTKTSPCLILTPVLVRNSLENECPALSQHLFFSTFFLTILKIWLILYSSTLMQYTLCSRYTTEEIAIWNELLNRKHCTAYSIFVRQYANLYSASLICPSWFFLKSKVKFIDSK